MGIEPTGPHSRRNPTGFEDQAEHQLGCTPALRRRDSSGPRGGVNVEPWPAGAAGYSAFFATSTVTLLNTSTNSSSGTSNTPLRVG